MGKPRISCSYLLTKKKKIDASRTYFLHDISLIVWCPAPTTHFSSFRSSPVTLPLTLSFSFFFHQHTHTLSHSHSALLLKLSASTSQPLKAEIEELSRSKSQTLSFSRIYTEATMAGLGKCGWDLACAYGYVVV